METTTKSKSCPSIVGARTQTVQAETLQKMQAIIVPAKAITTEIAEDIYVKIKERQNKQTGQTALFVKRSFWKIKHHKGFDLRVILILAEAFENAMHMYNEPVDETHKSHNNFIDYSQYVSKIIIDDQLVFARFSLENLKVKPGKKQLSQFHSIHLSYEVKNNAAHPRVNSSIINLATWGAGGTTDLKLQHWLNFVKYCSQY